MSRRKRSARRRTIATGLALTVLLGGCGVDEGPDASGSPSSGTSVPERDAAGAEPSLPADGPAGAYLSLADYERDPAVFADDDVVLFFAASWCSTCQRTRANIEADLPGIPPGLVIVVVDYDTATEVRRLYGVTVQHTFVQIDADGTALKRWTGSLTADAIAQQTV